MATRCCWPPESWCGIAPQEGVGRSAARRGGETSRIDLVALTLGCVRPQHLAHLVGDADRRVERRRPDPVARTRSRGRAALAGRARCGRRARSPGTRTLPDAMRRPRPRVAEQRVGERGLAAARLPDEPEECRRTEVERDRVEDRSPLPARHLEVANETIGSPARGSPSGPLTGAWPRCRPRAEGARDRVGEDVERAP